MFTMPSMSQVATTFGQPESFAPGAWLRQRRQPIDSLLYLESGSVMLGVEQDLSMRHQLWRVDGPTWLDAAFALQGRASCIDMQAQTAGRLYVIPLTRFEASVANLPEAAQELLKDLAKSYCMQTEMAVSRLAQGAEARCAQWLLSHATVDPTPHTNPHAEGASLRVTLNARKRLIAAQLGIAPETFSRVLRQLREHGLIAGRGNVIELPQPGALKMLALG
ncbi:Crp/Fnr family transcriptional regulator [Comamonas sp. Y33R10-2]|uniref:Crp/Fnr family transcriptional regulator n=1 Tax=Comamonas sp. Y33R10-2 TaxID=2853257 RepID=UPI001C5CB95C|nr:Crp/Fnr family transcriptional regulator [Comamonas sp. Y33R10-2]QXZ09615.1 Crp/Fnr family transcriptional regulator [Comamonas sp. Y33R10-2]